MSVVKMLPNFIFLCKFNLLIIVLAFISKLNDATGEIVFVDDITFVVAKII